MAPCFFIIKAPGRNTEFIVKLNGVFNIVPCGIHEETVCSTSVLQTVFSEISPNIHSNTRYDDFC